MPRFLSAMLWPLMILWFLCLLVGHVIHGLRSHSNAPSVMAFKRDNIEAIQLKDNKNFLAVVNAVRGHLLRSRSTRHIFTSVAQQFFEALSPEVQKDFVKPTERNFYDYIFSNWPTLYSFSDNTESNANGILWGWVDKNSPDENGLHISSSIIEAAEAPTRKISEDFYNLIIVSIIMHELSHTFTKSYFNSIITPHGVGADAFSKDGESGWLVEETIFQGRLVVEWNSASKPMDDISRLVLTSPSGDYEISLNMATMFLASLHTSTLVWPEITTMVPVAVRGKFRGRLNDPHKTPKDLRSKIQSLTQSSNVGLGISSQLGPWQSLVGYDRRL